MSLLSNMSSESRLPSLTLARLQWLDTSFLYSILTRQLGDWEMALTVTPHVAGN